MLLFPTLLNGSKGPVRLSATWSDISFSSPTTAGSNEDRTLTFSGGGTRNISANIGGDDISGSLQYRINSGSWTAYSVPFALSSGQTLGWKADPIVLPASSTVTVSDDTLSEEIDAFDVGVS